MTEIPVYIVQKTMVNHCYGLFSACPLMVLNISVKFHENMVFNLQITIYHVQRATTPKVGKPQLWLLCFAHHLMVVNI